MSGGSSVLGFSSGRDGLWDPEGPFEIPELCLGALFSDVNAECYEEFFQLIVDPRDHTVVLAVRLLVVSAVVVSVECTS